MDRISKEKIKRLRKEEKYNEIFIEFGQKAYTKYVPKKYQIEEINRLLQERRFEDIYNKYGESLYNTISIKAMYDEIKEEKGTIKAILWKVGQKALWLARQIGFSTVFSLVALTSAVPGIQNNDKNNNAIKYEDEINEYKRNILEYAKEVRAMNLNDTQVFMKVMYDMWENIQGYATPDKNIQGFLELDLATNKGYGVCRNMASDVAKKLNEVNPDYNARTMIVISKKTEIDILKRKKTITNDEKEKTEINEENMIEELIPQIFGNHVIVLVDIEKYNLTLVLDPTNKGIAGIYQNGEIVMFNSIKEMGFDFDIKAYTNILMNTYGYSELMNNAVATIKSYTKPNISMEEVNEKFGIKAQNKALKELKMMEKEKLEMNTMTQNSNNMKEFKEELKVDMPTQITINSEQKHEKIQDKEMER